VLKGIGYLVSIASVFLLGIVAWQGADDGGTRLLVAFGMATSIIGMGMRWASFLSGEKPKSQSAPDRAGPATRAVPAQSRAHHEPGRSAHLT
jgi:hypothetical protein